MDETLFKNSPSGRLERILGGDWDGNFAFVPNPLPPPLEWDSSLATALSKADHALGEISGIGENISNPHLLIYPFMRREAVLSSRIEGTQSTFSDLLIFEATSKEKQGDVREVQNYVKAMEYGLQLLEKLPVSLRLIKEIHGILMEGVRGERSKPGEFRQEPNWIGPEGYQLNEATFVPPPVPEMNEALYQLEQFIHSNSDLPPLINIALIHYQFEAIHPFIDGNGRIGRLLIAFLLCERKLLSRPLLYVSDFFEKNRPEYYSHLLNVSQTGAWRPWIEFFLKAITEQSADSVKRSRDLLNLQQEYRHIGQQMKFPPTAQKLVELVCRRPIINAKLVQGSLGVTWDGANKAIQYLEKVDILAEVTKAKRNKMYVAQKIMDILR